jgi:hypothetical protein
MMHFLAYMLELGFWTLVFVGCYGLALVLFRAWNSVRKPPKPLMTEEVMRMITPHPDRSRQLVPTHHDQP